VVTLGIWVTRKKKREKIEWWRWRKRGGMGVGGGEEGGNSDSKCKSELLFFPNDP
jgi:hypothetical protein